jgi:hypothetical protein
MSEVQITVLEQATPAPSEALKTGLAFYGGLNRIIISPLLIVIIVSRLRWRIE